MAVNPAIHLDCSTSALSDQIETSSIYFSNFRNLIKIITYFSTNLNYPSEVHELLYELHNIRHFNNLCSPYYPQSESRTRY